MAMSRSLFFAISLAGLLLMPPGAGFEALAQESNTDLAEKTQNPVADLISIPLQNNANFGIGPNNRMQNLLNVQPVIPINLNPEWNLITRTLMPIIKQPDVRTTDDNTWGLGAIANQVWSIGGNNDRPNTSSFFTQPFINYNLSDGWYLTSAPIITADW